MATPKQPEAEAALDDFESMPEATGDIDIPDEAELEEIEDGDGAPAADAPAPKPKTKKSASSAASGGDAAGAMPLFDATKKKKKKRTKKVGFNPEAAAAGGDVAAPEAGEGGEGGEGATTELTAGAGSALFNESGEYTYDALLKRAFDLIGQSKPEKRSKIPLPQAFRIGTSRTLWANFPAIVKALNRTPQHLLNFVIVELGTTANLDGSGRVVIKGRFMPKQLESLVRRYLSEYVLCKTCGSRDTTLKKENRLHFLHCNSAMCGSTRSLPPLNKGYVHRIKRKKPT